MIARGLLGAASLLAAPAVLANPRTATADEVGTDLQAALEQSIKADPTLPGVSLTILAPRQGLNWSGAAGMADRATGERLSPGHAFRIASITKVFTATAALRLAEQGRLSLLAPIGPLLSAETRNALTQDGYDVDRITTFDLLTHGSGIFDYAEAPEYREAVLAAPSHRWTAIEQVEFAMRVGDPVAAPGVRYRYSDTGYVIAGEIVARAAGMPLPAAIRSLVRFDRLGLPSTYFETLEPAPPGERRAHQYAGTIDTTPIDPSIDLYGGGGLVSTTTDLVRFMRALVRDEIFEKRDTMAGALVVPPLEHEATENLHAPLLGRWTFGREICWGHIGHWGSIAFHCPASDTTVALTFNQAENALGPLDSDSRILIRGLTDRVADILSRLPEAQRKAAR